MATEKRLIDVNEAYEIARTSGLHDDFARCMADLTSLKELLEDCTTVDAVEVVRCRDCKWVENGKDYEAYCNHWKSGLYANVKDDDFCSYGERKDNGNEV